MLGWVLGAMALDLANTHKKKKEHNAKLQKIKDLKWRLNRPVTKDHYKKCVCLLCVNRRNSLKTEIGLLEQK